MTQINEYLNSFKKIIDLIIFGNFWVALGAVSQVLLTYELLNYSADFTLMICVFSATLATYNFCLLIQNPNKSGPFTNSQKIWFFSHYRSNLIITIVVMVLALFTFLFLDHKVQTLIVVLGIIALAYAFPIFTKENERFGLRKIPGIKLLLITLVWSLTTVMLPILNLKHTAGLSLSAHVILMMLFERFLFFLMITIPFDVRDLLEDEQSNLKTIATVFGAKKSYLFSFSLLLIYGLVLMLIFQNNWDIDFWSLMAHGILVGFVIYKSFGQKNAYYYYLILDGLLISQYIFVKLIS